MPSKKIPGLYKRGNVWWATFTVDGERFQVSTKTRSKKDAEKFLASKRTEIWHKSIGVEAPKKNTPAPRRGGPTLGQLCEYWAEGVSMRWEKSGRGYWARCIRLLGGDSTRADKVRGKDVEALKRKLMTLDLAPATVNRHINALSAGYNEAIRRELLDKNPCKPVRRLKEKNERNRVASDEEIKSLLEGAEGDPVLRLTILLGVETGMRLGEIAELEWQRISLGRRLVRLRSIDTKTGKPRQVPLSKTAVAALEPLEKEEGRVIKVSANGLSKRFRLLRDKLGIIDFRFHDLRHSAATRLRRAGVDVFTLMQILGHTSAATARRYQTVDEIDLLAAVDKLE